MDEQKVQQIMIIMYAAIPNTLLYGVFRRPVWRRFRAVLSKIGPPENDQVHECACRQDANSGSMPTFLATAWLQDTPLCRKMTAIICASLKLTPASRATCALLALACARTLAFVFGCKVVETHA